jgi:Sulfotransferase family
MFKHLHIVACSPRSGTTLLHEVMVTCFRVDRHYDHEVRFNLVSADGAQVVVSKRPKDTMYMPSVIDSDPELYVIYLLRDPRDVICSRHGKDRSVYYSNIRLWRQMHGFAKKMFGHDHFLEIRYEDFVRDPDATQLRIQRKFPWLEKLHSFSDYHNYATVSEKSATAMHSVRPIAPTSIGVWTRHPGRVKAQQLLHGSLSPDLIECGYESSAAWERVLDGVEPDTSRSLYPEKLRFWRKLSQHINALRKVAQYRRMRGRA